MRTMLDLRRGFSILSALFLLVVVSALGVFLVTISSTQQQTSAQDILGARAYQAARAGIDWGAYQVLRDQAFGVACRTTNNSQTISPLGGTLAGFTVVVSCTTNGASYVEDGTTLRVYELSALATHGTVNTPGRIERQISITISR
ncbi:MAG TPA: pilus assembly PilX N-terminal domain-containing protein [Paucimonas sp.]|nr:pilus assembly PilX N-terminal domain-containing protein [Paucimonas sp.]